MGTSSQNSSSKKTRRDRAGRIEIYKVALSAIALVVGIVLLYGWFESDRPLRQIENALKKGNTAEALKRLIEFQRDHPQDTRAMMLKARIYVEIGNLTEAIEIFRQLGAFDIADLHAWAKAHLLRSEWYDALQVLQRLLDLVPNDADALHEATACAFHLGFVDKAVSLAEKMSKIKGQEARALVQIGTLKYYLGNKQSAWEAWRTVLKYAPDATSLQVPAYEFFVSYGKLLSELGQSQEAVTVLRRSLKLKETADAQLYLGNALQQLNETDQAYEAWKRAVALSENSLDARNSLADFELSHRQYDAAEKWLEPLLTLPELKSSTTYLKERISLAKGDRESARRWSERTNELKKSERIRSTVDQILKESPDSYWGRAIRAYDFAKKGNWRDAKVMMDSLDSQNSDERFFIELSAAIERHGHLPSLELLPIHLFY